jgi:hypothetical protein
MKTHFFPKSICSAAMILIAVMILPGIGGAAVNNHNSNELLLNALSPFEDIIESAMAKDDKPLASSTLSATEIAAAAKNNLSPAAFRRLDQLVSEIAQYAKDQRYELVSLRALEAYKMIAAELDPALLKVPLEVIWLDYIGFEIQALSIMTDPDWDLLQKSVGQALALWSAVEPKIADKGLRDVYKSTLMGLTDALETKNIAMLHFAAQIDLDLVDLLENHFG